MTSAGTRIWCSAATSTAICGSSRTAISTPEPFMGVPSLVPQPRTDALALQAINDFQSDMAEIIGAPYSRSVQLTTYLLAGMVALAFLLMATVSLDTVVSSRGKLISRVPTIQIQPLETSV